MQMLAIYIGTTVFIYKKILYLIIISKLDETLGLQV